MSTTSSRPLRRGAGVLVTGGAGFVGSHVVDALLGRGYRVVVADDLSSGDRRNLAPEVPLIQRSILDEGLPAELEKHPIDAVVHCAAQVKVVKSMEDPALVLAVNVVGTRKVLGIAREVGARRFVFVSTGGAMYGDVESAATEETLPRPASFYAVHKYTAERYVELSGLSYGILRFSNVYGPRQRGDLEGGVVAVFQERLRTRQPVGIFGTGEQARDFVYVRDAVAAILVALETSRNGLWNVGVGYATTVNDLLRAMARVVAEPVEVSRLPPRPGEIFKAWLSFAKAERELGWRPAYSLEAGLQETVTWTGR
ncbi:MAG: NAD-dependent epimerase/dehydratase family protein [Chloroflexi bacterium]|nr:NAD-dependent epimerase/dehydratase family protein [Chloroflexota bacterium]